jgi:TP901 family phage tail tape measure protein
MGAPTASAEIFLGLNVEGLKKGFKKGVVAAKDFQQKLEKHRATMRKVAVTSGIAFGGMVAGIGATVNAAKKLEDEIVNALTLIDAQGEEYEAMQEKMSALAIKLSKDLGISADEIAKSFYQVLSAGADITSESFEQLTVTALKMAKTVGLETNQAVEILADTVNAFNMDMSEAEKISDVFFNTSKKVATTVPQLAEAFKEAGGTAATMGFSVEETAAVLAGFAERGIKGAKAGTTFRIMATRLGAATGEAADALEELGVQSFNADGSMRPMIDILKDMQQRMAPLTDEQANLTLKVIAGEEAFAKVGALLSGDLSKLEAWKDELNDTGATSEAFNKKLNSLSGQLGILKAEFEAIIIPIGKAFVPTIVKLAKSLGDIAKKMAPFIQQNAKFLTVLLGGGVFAAGLIAALSSLGLMLTALPAIFAAIAGPIGIVVAGVLALAGAIAYLTLREQKLPTTLKELDYELGKNAKKTADLKAQIDKLIPAGETLNSYLLDQANVGNDLYHELRALDLEYQQQLEFTEKLTKAKKDLVEQETRLQEAAKLTAAIPPPTTTMPGGIPAAGVTPFDDAYFDKAKMSYEEYMAAGYFDMHEQLYGADIDFYEQRKQAAADYQQTMMQGAIGATQAFFGTMHGMYEHFHGVIGKTVVAAAVESLIAALEAWRIAEIAKATGGAALSFGSCRQDGIQRRGRTAQTHRAFLRPQGRNHF